MAEVAIAGTFPRRGQGLLWDSIDREVLERDRVAVPLVTEDEDEFTRRGRRLPLLGTAVPGLEMKVVDPESREELPERSVGELLMRGTSVTPGYYKRDDATAELLQDGWLCTGDLAYILDGQLVLCGRIKDVIIVGGRNVFPEDIERSVGTIEGVRAGNVIAFGVEGTKEKNRLLLSPNLGPRTATRFVQRSTSERWRSVAYLHEMSFSLNRARCRKHLPGSCNGQNVESSILRRHCRSGNTKCHCFATMNMRVKGSTVVPSVRRGYATVSRDLYSSMNV